MGHTSDLDSFLNLHKEQLLSSGIPEHFWASLMEKIRTQNFDAGDTFQLMRIDYEDKDDGSSSRQPHEPVWGLQALSDIDRSDPKHVYLIDHAWTFRVEHAQNQLMQYDSLRTRMCNILGLDEHEGSKKEIAEKIFENVWRVCNTYAIGNADKIEERLSVWYVMDEIGSSVMHSDSPNCRIVPFVHVNEQIAYSLLFPIENIQEEDFVYRDFAEGITDSNQRAAALLPWKPRSFAGVSFKPDVPGDDYFLSGHITESLPDLSKLDSVEKSRGKLKVFSEYELINQHLTSDRFEVVEDEREADVLWLTTHFKDFAGLSQDSPRKFINQFPFEYVVTLKDLLCIVCRRSKDSCNTTGMPDFLPITYNLKTEIANFVAYFQYRAQDSLDNLWIVKPYNLARSLDTHITDNLNYIVRLPATGPKIVQKYITDPVLFARPECQGSVKFDIRYVLLLKSVKPLSAYVHREFYLRFANKPFELTDFYDYQKHFTVMNYDDKVDMKQMLCAEFKEKWQRQYPDHSWRDVERSILKMLREILECAVMQEPPLGIAHSPQSRALYAADIMLEWTELREIRPKILEINWTPDCKRACEFYPDFYNDVFGLLFLNEESEVFLKL